MGVEVGGNFALLISLFLPIFWFLLVFLLLLFVLVPMMKSSLARRLALDAFPSSAAFSSFSPPEIVFNLFDEKEANLLSSFRLRRSEAIGVVEEGLLSVAAEDGLLSFAVVNSSRKLLFVLIKSVIRPYEIRDETVQTINPT